MGTRNSNQNVGYGTSIGYHCCSMDGSKGDRAGCKTNGAYTYDEAVANCAAFGKRLCTREEVLANKGSGTGCNFDGFLVWTSTPCTDSSQWRKGVAGATCDETCGAIEMRCDSSTQSTIRSCEDVAAVASQVGESCVGCKNIRHKAYAGTPFISAKDGGCWFLTEGAQSVCDDNAIGHHEPLSCCVLCVCTILVVGSIIATMICIVAIVFFAAIKCAKSQPKIRIYDDEQNENENKRVMEI